MGVVGRGGALIMGSHPPRDKFWIAPWREESVKNVLILLKNC